MPPNHAASSWTPCLSYSMELSALSGCSEKFCFCAQLLLFPLWYCSGSQWRTIPLQQVPGRQLALMWGDVAAGLWFLILLEMWSPEQSGSPSNVCMAFFRLQLTAVHLLDPASYPPWWRGAKHSGKTCSAAAVEIWEQKQPMFSCYVVIMLWDWELCYTHSKDAGLQDDDGNWERECKQPFRLIFPW